MRFEKIVFSRSIKFVFFIFFLLSFNFYLSQDSLINNGKLIFVEGGRKRQFLTLKESINSFDIDHVETMIKSYETKLRNLDTLNSENKFWINRINYELVLLNNRRNDLFNK